MTDVNNDKLVGLRIKKPLLQFYDEKLESDYQSYFQNNLNTSFVFYLGTLFVFWFVDIIMQSKYSDLSNEKITKILKIAYILSGLLLLIRPLKINFINNYLIYYYIHLIIETICIYVEKSDNDTKLCIQYYIIFTFPLFFANISFKSIFVGVLLYYLATTPAVFINDFNFGVILNNEYFLYTNLPLLYHRALFILGCLIVMLIYGYNEDLSSRISFLKFHKKSLDLKKDFEIYNNLVPEFVREKMKNGLRGAAIDYEVVTILFCDISEFDKLVSSMTAKDLIFLLDKIYNTFDQLCTLHGLQKIETVGKTYMAAGGLKETENDVDPLILNKHHAIRTFELAIDMIDVMQHMTLENGEILKLKSSQLL